MDDCQEMVAGHLETFWLSLQTFSTESAGAANR